MARSFIPALFMLVCSAISVNASSDFISGTVVNTNGKPEAGVWVIAETDILATEYRKTVVTDNKGRFLLPSSNNLF